MALPSAFKSQARKTPGRSPNLRLEGPPAKASFTDFGPKPFSVTLYRFPPKATFGKLLPLSAQGRFR